MNKLLANTATAILVLCALTVTGLAIRRELAPPSLPAAQYSEDTRPVPDWRSYARGRRMGPPGARVTIVEFSDFQCPFCRTMSGRLRAMRQAHPEDVAVVYRHLLLPYHTHAQAAARASECAGRQGRFEAYHDALFAHQDSIGSIPWTTLAAAAGVPDPAELAQCMASEAPAAGIEQDVDAAKRLAVSGTPALIVNGTLLTSSGLARLEAMVERELKSAGR